MNASPNDGNDSATATRLTAAGRARGNFSLDGSAPTTAETAADRSKPAETTRRTDARAVPMGGVALVILGAVIGAAWAQSPSRPAGADDQLSPTIPQVIQAREGRDVAGSGDLIGFSHVNDRGTQVITLVNTRKLWMAVYHISPEGEIRLTSSRAIDADFTLQLNATDPLPEDIRQLQPSGPRNPSE